MDFQDENEWIKDKYYYDELKEDKIRNIFYFTLLWNITEKKFFQTDATMIKIKDFVKISDTDTIEVDEIYNYFKNRYTLKNKVNDIFKSFTFNRRNIECDYKKFTKETLEGTNICSKQKLEALLYITFRLRNNLYHGIKKVEELYEQNENFKYANQLLIKLIDKN